MIAKIMVKKAFLARAYWRSVWISFVIIVLWCIGQILAFTYEGCHLLWLSVNLAPSMLYFYWTQRREELKASNRESWPLGERGLGPLPHVCNLLLLWVREILCVWFSLPRGLQSLCQRLRLMQLIVHIRRDDCGIAWNYAVRYDWSVTSWESNGETVADYVMLSVSLWNVTVC